MTYSDRKLYWLCWVAFCGVLLAGLPIRLYLGIQNGKANDTPTNRIVAIDAGTKDQSNRKSNIRKFRVSAYCACEKCCGRWGSVPVSSGCRKTASGHRIDPGGRDYGRICAAPKSYPFETRIMLTGYGEVTVRDRGGSIKAAGDAVAGKVLKYDRLDILMRTHEEANQFGVQYLTGTIIEETDHE